MVINKIIGAIVLVALSVFVIETVGNLLVQSKEYSAAAMKAAEKPAAKATPKKAAALAPVGPLLAAASAEKGAKVFKKCAACHNKAKGAKHKIGPNLWEVVNAARAGQAGFSYSSALKGSSGKWGYEDLNAFLARPKAFVPGTKMVFGGLKKASDRANLIKYLRSLSGSPAALP